MIRTLEEPPTEGAPRQPRPAGQRPPTGTGIVPPDDIALGPGQAVEVNIPGIGRLQNRSRRRETCEHSSSRARSQRCSRPSTRRAAATVEAMHRHVDWLRERGVATVSPMGTTGEGPSLSLKERTRVLDSLASARPISGS